VLVAESNAFGQQMERKLAESANRRIMESTCEEYAAQASANAKAAANQKATPEVASADLVESAKSRLMDIC
jgi:hypothetical protein